MQYKEGDLFDNRFVLEEFRGTGTYGEVWLARDNQTDIEVAVKIYIAMNSEGLEDFKKEYKVSFELNHSNLLHANFLEVCKADKRPYLVMPFCPSGSVVKLAGNIQEKELWRYIRDVASGLAYLHSQEPPIIHQDIKLDNILIAKNGDFVITDFGISQQVRSTLRKSAMHLNSAGSMSYMGPERFSKHYTAIKASDIWSLGVTIFELGTGDLPFCGMGGSMQKQGAEIPDMPDEYSADMNMVMQSCLAKETWDRPSAAQLAEYAGQKVRRAKAVKTWGNNPESQAEQVQDSQPDANQNRKTIIMNPSVQETVKMQQPHVAETPVAEPLDSEKEPAQTKRKTGWIKWVAIIVGLAAGVAAGMYYPLPL